MTPHVTEAQYLNNYTIKIRFADGTGGIVDLKNELDGEIFKPLRDVNYFKNFTVNPELHTITWPNGADIAPEFLYRAVQQQAA